MKPALRILVIACLFPVWAQAATFVEMKDPAGVTRIWTEGSKTRMDMSGDRGFMLVDSQQQTLYVVLPSRKTIMDISSTLRQAPESAGKPASYKKEGDGPDVAGYPTTRYSFSADGKHCGMVLASSEARDDAGLDTLFRTMDRMAAHAQSLATPFMNAAEDPCVQAEMQISGTIDKIGVPLQVSDANGKVASEVVKIDPDAKLPPGAFELPKDYEVQNTAMMMERAREMQKMMQQMSPETQQQIQKLMQQYQQQ